MADVDGLASRTVALVELLARRGETLAIGVAVVTGVAAVSVYLLGFAALDGPAGDAWPLLGALVVAGAVAAPLLAWWRLHAVRRRALGLAGEVRTLLQGDSTARRVVIDTVEASDVPGASRPVAGPAATPAVVVQTRGFGDLRRVVATHADLRDLPRALRAVTTFPGLLAIGLLATIAFAFVGLVFLAALAL